VSAPRDPPPGAGPRRFPGWTALELVLAGSLLALFLVPLASLFAYAPPSEIVRVAGQRDVQLALEVTLYASALAVAVSVLLGVPLGYLLARRRFPGRSVVASIVALPVVVPHLLVGLGFLLLTLPGTPLGNWTAAVGLPLRDTILGVVLVMVFVSAPYTVLASELSFRAVDPKLVEAARSLGADAAQAFRTVTVPLAVRGIGAGVLLSWARAVSEIGGILVLAYLIYPSLGYSGPVTSTVSVYVYNLVILGNLKDAAAVSSLFLLVAFVLFVVVRLLERSGRLPWRRGELLP
jgi:ABC-type sulfate transport system permease component